MNEGRTDHEVLDGSPVVTNFNGVRYVWRQQMRREQRRVRSRLMEITARISLYMSGNDADKLTVSIDAVNMILDLAEDYCPEMATDIDNIEDSIRDEGLTAVAELITGVYQPLFDAWLKPWIKVGGEDAGGKSQSIKKRKPTK
jgi:hypothetical protein